MYPIKAWSVQRLALGIIAPLVLMGCAEQSVGTPRSLDTNRSAEATSSPTVVAEAPTATSEQPQPTSDPRSVVDQFYNAYIFEDKPWKELQEDLDPATYEQLSQVKLFDADPITNAQVPAWEYAVGDARISGNTAEVDIRLKVELRQPPPTFNWEMTVVLQNNGDRWQIRNIIYSPEPLPSGEPSDLLHIWRP